MGGSSSVVAYFDGLVLRFDAEASRFRILRAEMLPMQRPEGRMFSILDGVLDLDLSGAPTDEADDHRASRT